MDVFRGLDCGGVSSLPGRAHIDRTRPRDSFSSGGLCPPGGQPWGMRSAGGENCHRHCHDGSMTICEPELYVVLNAPSLTRTEERLRNCTAQSMPIGTAETDQGLQDRQSRGRLGFLADANFPFQALGEGRGGILVSPSTDFARLEEAPVCVSPLWDTKRLQGD